MKDSFIFYKSFYDAAAQAPDEATRREILWHMVEVCIGIKTVDDIPFPASAVAVQALASVESAKRRYDKSVEDGGKGGRPKKWIDRTEAELAFKRLGNWTKVAKELDVSEDTLYRARMKWKNTAKPQNPQNPNVYVYDNDSVSVSESVYDNDSDTYRNSNLKTPDAPTTDPNGSPSRPATKRKTFEEMWVPPD